jgi:hypothetical protein
MARRDLIWASKAETNGTLLLSFSLGTKIKGKILAKYVREIFPITRPSDSFPGISLIRLSGNGQK